MKELAKTIVFGNFWIALSASSLGMASTAMLLSGSDSLDITLEGPIKYGIFLFFSTMLTYNAMRLKAISSGSSTTEGEMRQWVRKYQGFTKISMAVSLLIVGFLALQLKWQSIAVLAGTGILSLAYFIPVLPGEKDRSGLRTIAYLKTILVAIVWTMSCAVVPWIEFGSNDNPIMLFVFVFLYILGLTVIFDIRDIEYDKEEGVKTLASKKGISITRRVSIICLVLAFIVLVFFPGLPADDSIILSLILSLIITLVVVWKTDEGRPELWYTGLIDGLITLTSILVIHSLL